jgi:sugar phosphate isomerase/epimerase
MKQTQAMGRRCFLQTGAAATFGLANLRSVIQAADPKNEFGGFTMGAQSYCFRNFDTEGALKRTHDLGLHFIEFFQKHAPLNSTPEQINALLKMCKEYEITPIAFGVQGFTKDHDANKKVFDFAKAMGIKYLSADPDPNSFDSLDKLVDEYKIAIAIHPHGPTGGGKLHRWYSAEVIMKVVKDHHKLIGSCLDTGHLIRSAQPPFFQKLDPAEQVRVMGDRNLGMHLKDHDNLKRTDVVYGRGALNVASVLKALKEVKFNGYLSIEYEAHPDNPVPDMKACLDVLKDAIKNLA